MINNAVGTGKTGQALLLVQSFYKLRKVLIIAGGQLSKQWEKQVKIWLDSTNLGIKYSVVIIESGCDIHRALW